MQYFKQTMAHLLLAMIASAPEIGSHFAHYKPYETSVPPLTRVGKSDVVSFGRLRLRGGGKFDENHAVGDVIQRNTKRGSSTPPSAFENLVASTLFTAQVQRDELRMLKYLHIVSARFLFPNFPLRDVEFIKNNSIVLAAERWS